MNSDSTATPGRRSFLAGSAAVLATAAVATSASAAPAPTINPYADPAKPMLPPSTMQLDLARTALVVVDPQIDFLSPKGVA